MITINYNNGEVQCITRDDKCNYDEVLANINDKEDKEIRIVYNGKNKRECVIYKHSIRSIIISKQNS